MNATAQRLPNKSIEQSKCFTLLANTSCVSDGNACPSMAQLDHCKEISRKTTEIVLGSPAALSPSLLSVWTYYHFLTLNPPCGIRREAWPINQQMKGPFALFLYNTFFSCTVLNVRFIKFPPKKKKIAIQPKNLKAWACQNELTSAAAWI